MAEFDDTPIVEESRFGGRTRVWIHEEAIAYHAWRSADPDEIDDPGPKPDSTFTLEYAEKAVLVMEFLRGPSGPAGPMGASGFIP